MYLDKSSKPWMRYGPDFIGGKQFYFGENRTCKIGSSKVIWEIRYFDLTVMNIKFYKKQKFYLLLRGNFTIFHVTHDWRKLLTCLNITKMFKIYIEVMVFEIFLLRGGGGLIIIMLIGRNCACLFNNISGSVLFKHKT